MWNLVLQALKQNHYITTNIMPMVTELGRVVNDLEDSHPQSHMTIRLHGLANSRENYNYYHFTTTLSMTNKLGRRVTYIEGLLPIKSNYSSMTWSFEIT